MKDPEVFVVTRTVDNEQLGLGVLIDSLQPGETKSFVATSEYMKMKAGLTEKAREVFGPAGFKSVSNIMDERDKLRADLAVAIEALEKLKRHPKFLPDCACFTVSEEALAKLNRS